MKLFQSIQRNYAIFGINVDPLIRARTVSNETLIMLTIFVFTLYTISAISFLLNIPTTMIQIITCIFWTSSNICAALCFVNIMYNMPATLDFFESVEKIIDASK